MPYRLHGPTHIFSSSLCTFHRNFETHFSRCVMPTLVVFRRKKKRRTKRGSTLNDVSIDRTAISFEGNTLGLSFKKRLAWVAMSRRSSRYAPPLICMGSFGHPLKKRFMRTALTIFQFHSGAAQLSWCLSLCVRWLFCQLQLFKILPWRPKWKRKDIVCSVYSAWFKLKNAHA